MPNDARRAPKSLQRWPLAVAMIAVAASVTLGVFGPRLVDVRSHDALRPLGDLALSVREVEERMSLEARDRPAEAPGPTDAELASLVRESLGVDWTPPPLTDDGCVPILAGPVPLSKDGRGVVILFECAGGDGGRHLVIAALPDDGTNGVFDEFGRARAFDASESILEPDVSTDPDGPSTLAWTDGALLIIGRAPDRERLERLRAHLESH